MRQYRSSTPRLTIDVLHSASGSAEFAADVLRGLSAKPKYLNPMYFYDAAGSALFERICRLSEYYVTRTEREILRGCADEIAGFTSGSMSLVELGSGSSEKTRLLIEAILKLQGVLHYIPVDISFSIVKESAEQMMGQYPGLNITAKVAEYNAGLSHLRDADRGQKLIVFLGSNLGNFNPVQALDFLVSIRRLMSGQDYFLIGNDLAKDPSILVPAYDDAQGITAAFNLNVLQRINRELGGRFDLSSFSHRALYNQAQCRIEMHLRSNTAQRVLVGNLSTWFEFEQGETIHTENSYKYTVEQLDSFFREAGLALVKRWTDDHRWFSLSLLSR